MYRIKSKVFNGIVKQDFAKSGHWLTASLFPLSLLNPAPELNHTGLDVLTNAQYVPVPGTLHLLLP